MSKFTPEEVCDLWLIEFKIEKEEEDEKSIDTIGWVLGQRINYDIGLAKLIEIAQRD